MTGNLVAEGVVAGYAATDMILKGVSIRVEPGESRQHHRPERSR